MDLHTPDYGNLDLPHGERKHYRKICYFLGLMLNADGQRFVDEGKDFRNYTYAQFGRAIMEQPGHVAWQIFDAKVDHLLYSEYRFHDAPFRRGRDPGRAARQARRHRPGGGASGPSRISTPPWTSPCRSTRP